MDDQIQCLPEYRKIKYAYMIVNIVTHFSDLSSMVGKNVKYLDFPVDDLKQIILYSCINDFYKKKKKGKLAKISSNNSTMFLSW